MPELPEVETIRSDLAKKILNKKIKKVEVRLPKIVKPESFTTKLTQNTFTDITRRGKLMVFHLKTGQYMLVHLKMTGQLVYRNHNQVTAGGHSQKGMGLDLPNKYSHVIFSFENGSQLFYNDLRQFGYLRVVDQAELDKVLAKFGIEPLKPEFTPEKWQELTKNRRTNIKAFLLNQAVVTGIGNIYADEVLFASHVLPTRTVDSLTKREKQDIYQNIRAIIKKAVLHRGTTFNDYVDADGKKGSFIQFLKVFHRDGDPCLECGAIIQKTRVAGRGTHFCLKCQK
jgi:formamidopyrimidine-DNA glycosylase